MADTTTIEWCDSTFNPWIGCTRISRACDDCYAARSTPARALGVMWGPSQPRHRTADSTWEQPRAWQRQAAAFQALHGRRRRVFCASLADVFDNEVPAQWRADLFDLIKATPALDWLLLTKRVGNAWKMMADACGVSMASLTLPLPNVWLGATVVNQAEADRDVPRLLATPAVVRFLSVEPMLGPTRLPLTRCDNGSLPGPGGVGGVMCPDCSGALRGCQRLHWVICGGESGPRARPMHPDWARSLRDQCAAAGVAFMFKQHGEWAPGSGDFGRGGFITAAVDQAGRVAPGGVSVRDYPAGSSSADGWSMVHKAGKKAAGRLLDGREHNEFPEVRHA